jgi:hypothetical protein
VRLDVLCGAYQISLVHRTVRFGPKSRIFRNHLVGELFVRTSFYVFRFTLKGY